MFPRRDRGKDREVPSLLDDERGVSPVIGTILVLSISTVGIFAVMYWGVPAMTEVQDRTSFEAVLQQYAVVDGTVENVVRGGAPDKASTVQLSVPGGSLEWNEGTRFLIEIYFEQDASDPVLADFAMTNWADRDATVNVRNVGEDLGDGALVVTNWRGAERDVRTIDVDAWDGDDDGDESDDGVDHAFLLPLPLHEHVISLTIQDGPDRLYEAWVLDIGQLKWEFGTSLNVLEMIAENAATLTNQSGTFWLHDRPLIHAEMYPDQVHYERFTFYLAQLVRNPNLGSPGVEGAGAYKVLFALEDNYLRNANVNVTRFDIRVHGRWAGAWLGYFDDVLGLGPGPAGDGVTYAAPGGQPVRFALFHSRVWTTILPFHTVVTEDGATLEESYNPPPPDPDVPWPQANLPWCEQHWHAAPPPGSNHCHWHM